MLGLSSLSLSGGCYRAFCTSAVSGSEFNQTGAPSIADRADTAAILRRRGGDG
jgi:hypothetical protein